MGGCAGRCGSVFRAASCLSVAILALASACARGDAPSATNSIVSSTTTSSTWLTTTTVPRSIVTGGSADYSVNGAWVMQTDRASSSSRPWIHLNQLPELADFDQYSAQVDIAPDGSLLAVAATGSSASLDNDLPPRSELYVASTLQPGDVRRVDSGLTSPAMVSFSPDGRWIAVVGDSSLSLVPLDGGQPVHATSNEWLPYPQTVTWSADGRQLSVLNNGGRGQPWTVTFTVNPATGTAGDVRP